MPKLLPDQSFYPSPTMAMQAPVETLAYVALLNSNPSGSDALAVLDVDPASPGYGAQIARVNMPGAGDELHHFGWNVCSSCLCPNSPHPHMQRRYLVVPGMRSSRIHKVIEIPAEPAAADDLPPLLKGFGAVPPLVTDLNLSLDDRFLYVSCWGTGELKQFDVSDPFNPVETSSVKLGGIVRRQAHPSRPDTPLNGAPQMIEISRDGKRLYVTNSLYRTWDDQFYPDGIKGWLAKIDVRPNGIELDRTGVLEFDGMRPHQVHLEGGDASSDSYCFE